MAADLSVLKRRSKDREFSGFYNAELSLTCSTKLVTRLRPLQPDSPSMESLKLLFAGLLLGCVLVAADDKAEGEKSIVFVDKCRNRQQNRQSISKIQPLEEADRPGENTGRQVEDTDRPEEDTDVQLEDTDRQEEVIDPLEMRGCVAGFRPNGGDPISSAGGFRPSGGGIGPLGGHNPSGGEFGPPGGHRPPSGGIASVGRYKPSGGVGHRPSGGGIGPGGIGHVPSGGVGAGKPGHHHHHRPSTEAIIGIGLGLGYSGYGGYGGYGGYDGYSGFGGYGEYGGYGGYGGDPGHFGGNIETSYSETGIDGFTESVGFSGTAGAETPGNVNGCQNLTCDRYWTGLEEEFSLNPCNSYCLLPQSGNHPENSIPIGSEFIFQS